MSTNFRSSFNGFNREDVVHYLDYLNKKHDEALSQLSSEAEELRQKLENAMQTDSEETDSLKERCQKLEDALTDSEKEKEALGRQLSELQEKLEQSEKERQSLEERLNALRGELDSARAQADREKCRLGAAQSRQELELEAYRRAERAERMARERADQVYRQTNGVLADATVKVEEAAGQIADISDHVMSQLDLLRSAVVGSKQALADAAAGMYSLKPKED